MLVEMLEDKYLLRKYIELREINSREYLELRILERNGYVEISKNIGENAKCELTKKGLDQFISKPHKN